MTPRLNNTTQVSDPRGMPTIELLKLWAELAREIDALKAQIADHETRITALEP